jgi:predicted transcriptional regulator
VYFILTVLDFKDHEKSEGITLRGVQPRLELTQKETAKKMSISQGDLSRIEKRDRA